MDGMYWSATKRLVTIVLAIWFFFGFVIHMFVNILNEIVIIGFPLGYYMAAQGSLIAFVVIIFYYSTKQDELDREHGVAEED